MDAQEPDNKITDLGAVREGKLIEQICTGEPAFAAGYRPAEELANWYLAGGYTYADMLHAMVYSAAARLFRDLRRRTRKQRCARRSSISSRISSATGRTMAMSRTERSNKRRAGARAGCSIPKANMSGPVA
jgi:hypothetical protein